MNAPIMVAVDVPLLGDERRKNWAKIVTNVDDLHSSGWAFEGEFIAVGGIQDVPVDSVVLVYGERGSKANPQIEARVFTANSDGTLTPHDAAKGRAWARTLRDLVADLLDRRRSAPGVGRSWHPDLMAFTDDALREELRRRG